MTKISDASLVAAATANMKMPTGEPGDLAISVDQIRTFAQNALDPLYWKVTGTTTLTGNSTVELEDKTLDFASTNADAQFNVSIVRPGGIFSYVNIYDQNYAFGVSDGAKSIDIALSPDGGAVVTSQGNSALSYGADYSAINAGNPRWIPDEARVAAMILSALDGMAWKTAVKVATTANITLTGEQTIDGVSIVEGDRILVKDQSSLPDNGIYVCAAGAWSRSSDANTAAELHNATVSVSQGSSNADTTWTQTTDNINLGVSNIVFVQAGSTTPDATETTKGKAEIATQAETNTGTDDTRFVTPLKLKNQDFLQALLVSGTNIKTVNGNSILGSGNLAISGGSRIILYKNHVQGGTGGGTTNETIVDSFLVAGGTMGANDALDIDLMFSKVNQNATWEMKVYVHTSAALGGTLIAQFSAGATIRYNRLFRTMWFRNSVSAQTMFNTAATASNDDYSTSAVVPTALAIDFSTDKYFVITVDPNSASDTCFIETSLFEIIRN